ncbi:MAG TPA: MmcQ/YjbR family DNA-binding protein [Acidimicrobiales bacterium]|nr:MmcQ/YjbR family DNA-binding protein [Acidimicrobiales bacterium]
MAAPTDLVSGVPDEFLVRVGAMCEALPETARQSDRFAHSFRVRRSVYAQLLAPEDQQGRAVPMVIVRADPVERDVLAAIGHPYFPTRSGADRVGVLLDDRTDWEEIGELVTESYRIVAPKKLAALLDDT